MVSDLWEPLRIAFILFSSSLVTFCCLWSLPLFRTDALLVKLSLLVGQQVFYGALWGSMLVTPMVRLPASVFVVTHFDRMVPLSQQTYMLGYGHCAVVSVHVCPPSVAVWFPDSPGLSFMFLCASPDKVSLSFSARFKCVGAEEHAWSPPLLFPLCNMSGR